jgi:uncharacterized protein YegP (UPF0339 family)
MAYDDIWDIYQDQHGGWRWTRRARNNEIVGASTESYRNRSDCVENARRNGYSGS